MRGIKQLDSGNEVKVYVKGFQDKSINVRTDKKEHLFAFWKYLQDGSRTDVRFGCDFKWIPDTQRKECLEASPPTRSKSAAPAAIQAPLATLAGSGGQRAAASRRPWTNPELKAAIKRWRDGNESRKAVSLNYNDWKRPDLLVFISQHQDEIQVDPPSPEPQPPKAWCADEDFNVLGMRRVLIPGFKTKIGSMWKIVSCRCQLDDCEKQDIHPDRLEYCPKCEPANTIPFCQVHLANHDVHALLMKPESHEYFDRPCRKIECREEVQPLPSGSAFAASEPDHSAAGLQGSLSPTLANPSGGVGSVSPASSSHITSSGGASMSPDNSSQFGAPSLTTAEGSRTKANHNDSGRQEPPLKRKRGADDGFASFNFKAFFTAADRAASQVQGLTGLAKGITLEKDIADRNGKTKPDYAKRISQSLDHLTTDVLHALYDALGLDQNGAKIKMSIKGKAETVPWIENVFIPNFVAKFSV